MDRSELIDRLANQLHELIMSSYPHMCCFGRALDENDNTLHHVVGYEGYIDLHKLAEWVIARMG